MKMARNRTALLGLLLALLIPVLPLRAEPSSTVAGIDSALLEALNRRGDLTLHVTTLTDALMAVSENWNVNIVVGEGVDGQVSGIFRDAPLHEILDSLLQSSDYTYRPVGRSLVIQSRGKRAAVHPLFQSATIPLRTASAEEIIEAVNLLASPEGRVQAIPSANSLIVFDFPDRVAAIRQFVTQLDRVALGAVGDASDPSGKLDVAQFAPHYVEAQSLREVVQSMISKDGKLGVMEDENRIVVVDYPGTLELIRKTIKQLDVPRPQVRITALIYDISLEDMEKLGINWGQAVKWQQDSAGDSTGLLSIDSIMQVPAAAGEPTSVLTLMNLSKHFDIQGVVDAMARLSNARLLADPTVTVVDRESAKIQIVTEIPFQQLTQTSQGGNIGSTAFREAGVSLTVKPMIAHDGTLKLDVTPMFSRLAGFTSGQLAQPIIDKREAQTVVRVANDQTLVIGGLRQRSDIRSRRGVPYLKDMKHLGHLFRARDDSVAESELVVFITPHIVAPTDFGTPREGAVLQKSSDVLNRVPVAPDLEFPYCECDVFEVPGEVIINESPELIEPPLQLPDPPTAARLGGGRVALASHLRRSQWSATRHRPLIRHLPPVADDQFAPRAAPAEPIRKLPSIREAPAAAPQVSQRWRILD